MAAALDAVDAGFGSVSVLFAGLDELDEALALLS